MTIGRRVVFAVVLLASLVGASAQGFGQAAGKQPTKTKRPKGADKIQRDTTPYKPTILFNSTEPLEFTLTLNVKQIKKDRGDEPPSRPATFALKDTSGKPVDMPIHVRTRGIWRKKNCDIPPLRIDFTKDKVKGTVFAGQNHVKLAIPCRFNDRYEQLTLAEFNLNRAYTVLTPLSHRVRLARLTLVDSASGKPEFTRWSFVMEDESEVAGRNHGRVYDVKGATSSDLDPSTAAIAGLFQYMIGNTDYSVQALHNVELMARDTSVYPIIFDFDFAGAVNAPYAVVDYRLSIKRVTDRLFRGPCAPASYYPAAIAHFKAKRDSITALYSDALGKLMDPGKVKETLEYFDDFYKIVDDSRRVKREMLDACPGLS